MDFEMDSVKVCLLVSCLGLIDSATRFILASHSTKRVLT